jgi:hypothetical protein
LQGIERDLEAGPDRQIADGQLVQAAGGAAR